MNNQKVMFDAIVNQGDVCRIWQLLAIQFGSRDVAGNVLRIVDSYLVARRAIAKRDRIARPRRWNARIDAQLGSPYTESQDPFQPSAVKPSGRTRVPCPSASPHMRGLGVYIASDDIGFRL